MKKAYKNAVAFATVILSVLMMSASASAQTESPLTSGDRAITMQGPNGVVLRSADGGQTWTRVDNVQQTFAASAAGAGRNGKVSQVYPNPTVGRAAISYRIELAGNVTLAVFDQSGSEVSVQDGGYQEAGEYQAEFNGDNLQPGVYHYRLTADHQIVGSGSIVVQR